MPCPQTGTREDHAAATSARIFIGQRRMLSSTTSMTDARRHLRLLSHVCHEIGPPPESTPAGW